MGAAELLPRLNGVIVPHLTRLSAHILILSLSLFFSVGIKTPSLAATGPKQLPGLLISPQQGVICNERVKVCYDAQGVSVGITQEIMGQEAADQLSSNLTAVDKKFFDPTNFKPVQGVSCHTLEKACYKEDTLSTALSSALFGENAEKYGPEVLPGTSWAWNGSCYNNDTEVRPEESNHFKINFKTDGSVQLQADCNTVHGSYHADGKSISITLGPSTMMACGPKSLDHQFLKDLQGVATWFLKRGDLYLDIKSDTGTMDFYRSLE